MCSLQATPAILVPVLLGIIPFSWLVSDKSDARTVPRRHLCYIQQKS